jgi:hypothetical protein
MEYQRTQNGAGEVYQWVDSKTYVVIDIGSNPPRMEKGFSILSDALEYVGKRTGWESRLVIVTLDSIRGYRIER